MRLKNIFWCFTWLVILAGLCLLLALRSYRAFTQEELVAVVRCEMAPKGAPYGFLLYYAPVTRGMVGTVQRFTMYGDQWVIGGDILKWHPWINLIGFKNCHKLTRLNSRYLKAVAEIRLPKSAYDLNGGTDPLWRWLYRFGSWIPFVEAVYGNAAYIMVQPSTRWGVYVTLSGYLIKPLQAPAV